MAITASTFGTDRILTSAPNNGKSLFNIGKNGVGSSTTWYQGDLICYDTGTTLLRVVAATTDAATLVGIADNSVVNGQLLGPYPGITAVSAAQSSPGFVGPKYGVVANMKLKTGDTLAFGAKVYLADTLDTQTVSATDPGDHNYVGIYVGPGVTSAPAGTLVPCSIVTRYPTVDVG